MPKVNVNVRVDGLDRGRKTIGKLRSVLRRPERTLRQMGQLLLANAQQAFRDQKLGDTRWPARYENRGQPHVNVAGVVADFIAGRSKPKQQRYQDRPAGIDTGQSLRQLTPNRVIVVRGRTLSMRLPSKQAKKMQSPNDSERTSVQRVTRGVKDKLAKYMKTSRRRIKRARKSSQPLTREDAGVQKLGFLFSRTQLRTKAARRPMFGIWPEVQTKLVRIAAGEFLAGGVDGNIS